MSRGKIIQRRQPDPQKGPGLFIRGQKEEEKMIYEYIEEDYEPILYDDKYYSNHPNHVL